MNTLASLPSELASQVCQLLEEEDLLRFCGVSKWFSKQVRPHLYQEVVLCSGRLPYFLRTVINHPRLADLVRHLRLSYFKSCAIKKKGMEFFRKHLVGTGTHAGTFWANIIADPRDLSGILVEVLLLKLVNLEQLDMTVDIDPNFMLLSSVDHSSEPALPASLKSVDLWGEYGTGNLGALHAILAASRVQKVTADFLSLVQGIPEDGSRYNYLRHLQLIACKLKKQELQCFLRQCSHLQTFCYTADAFESDHLTNDGLLDRFEHSQITAKDLVEALTVNESTLRDLHIDTRVTSIPIENLRSFTRLERLRIARRDLALSSRDLEEEEEEEDDDDDDDDDDNDEEGFVHLECDPFLNKFPSSLRLLRIDRADNALLKELTMVPTAVHEGLPNLEKVELQSHNQHFLTAAVNVVQYSSIVVELVGCRNDCWNCNAATARFMCKWGC